MVYSFHAFFSQDYREVKLNEQTGNIFPYLFCQCRIASYNILSDTLSWFSNETPFIPKSIISAVALSQPSALAVLTCFHSSRLPTWQVQGFANEKLQLHEGGYTILHDPLLFKNQLWHTYWYQFWNVWFTLMWHYGIICLVWTNNISLAIQKQNCKATIPRSVLFIH